MTIREATPDDADTLVAYMQRLTEEPDLTVPWAPGEFRVTVEEERKILEDFRASDNSIYLVAEIGGQIVGILDCKGSQRQANRHTGSFGVSVAREWRNKGVGTALLERLIVWAESTARLQRLELEVYAHNAPAIHLYQKFGFVEEGRRHKAYFQQERFILMRVDTPQLAAFSWSRFRG